MAEFAYNNAKNASIGHTPFELNYDYHLWTSYEENINPHSQFKSTNELGTKFRELMTICRKNFQHA